MRDPLSMTASELEALDEEKTQMILGAWVSAKRRELPEALAGSASKLHARLAKKALYQLKSQGVALSAPVRTEPPPARPAAPEELQGVLSGIVGTGERAAFFGKPRSGGGVDVYQAVFSDEEGLVTLSRSDSTRAAYRKHLEALEDSEVPVVMVGFSRIRQELEHALWLNFKRQAPLPDDIDHTARLLDLTPRERQLDIPPASPDSRTLARRAAKLHEEPELAQWMPSQTALETLSRRVDEVLHSPLQLSDAQRAEQLELKVRQAAEELLTPAARALYARRLSAMAELFEVNQKPDAATLARAEASLLAHTSEASMFAEAMFRRVLELSKTLSPQPQEPSPEAAPRTSPGGIVLP